MDARHQLILFSKMYGYEDASWTKPVDITVIEDKLLEESESRRNLYNLLEQRGILINGELDEDQLNKLIQTQAL
jgi:hypothetical protein